jgi:hypothetical protein
MSYCTLFVPNGRKDVFSNARGWRYFENIVEMN